MRAKGRGATIAAIALLLWIGFVGFVLWYDKRGYGVPPGQRELVQRSVSSFAREAGVDDSDIARLYSRSVFRRGDQSCVMFSTYRDRRGGALYCYRDSDGRLVEERLFGRPFGNRSPIEIMLDSIEGD